MEDNISDALKMAGAMLMFVIALTISVSSFSNARKAAQAILELNDREYDYTYVGNANSTKRIVGAETIIPSIYRAYVENYKIFFLDGNGNEMALYKKIELLESEFKDVPKNYIDLEKEGIKDNDIRNKFIKGIIYGNGALTDEDRTFFEAEKKIKFFTKGEIYDKILLCDKINNTRFEESLGEYYQQDLVEETDPNINTSDSDPVPEANKTKKRIITYKMIAN